MGILSWFRSRRPDGADVATDAADPDETPSLIRLRYEDPALEEIERAAADDVARVQQDDKYFKRSAEDSDEL